jgi:hypothetical protein
MNSIIGIIIPELSRFRVIDFESLLWLIAGVAGPFPSSSELVVLPVFVHKINF